MSRSEGIAFVTANASHRVALRGVRLRSRLSGMSQRTTIEQTFVNLERQAIEAVYTFPLPDGAAVCGFEVVTGDRVLTGTVEESEQAIEQYEDAVSEGHGAFLMEQDRPDVFTVRVGNLKPHQAATIRLTYVCPLEKADKSIRVAFPTTVAPRYVTDSGTDPLTAAMDSDALNPPHVLHVPYGLRMEVEVDLGRALAAIHSPSHAVQVQTTEAGTALVTLAAGVAEMNRDIVLTLDLKKEHQPTVQAAAGKQGESFLAVTFVPEFEEDDLLDPPAAETVFVLDCSGSMQGDSIRQATAALELCLRSLSPGDTFNVCRFGSTYRLMAKEPVPYTQQTLERALKYVRQGANLGGTELYAPLEAILEVPPKAGTVRQVILLTDGEVSNEPAVIELARRHRAHNRIFSFGIGAASSSYLVKGVARATGGAAEFITQGERIDDKVLRTFSRLSSPMVGDVSIDWGGAEVQTLAEIPPVFDGDVLSVFGRCIGRLPKEVTLSCNTSAGPRRWTVAVRQPAEDGGVIATMWARRTIQSIEEVNGLNTLRQPRSKPTREQEMLVALSKEFNLLSCLTTFIAVEHRSVKERNDGRPALRRVPVQLAKGWGGVEVFAGSGSSAAAALPSRGKTRASVPRRRALPRGGRPSSGRGSYDGGMAFAPRASADMPDAFAAPPPAGGGGAAMDEFEAELSPQAPGDDLHGLLSLQSAEGWFGWDDHAAAVLSQGGGDGWRAAMETRLLPLAAGVSREHVVQTVLVLLLLADRYADRESLWRRAYRKACRQFLARAFGKDASEVSEWLEALRSALKRD